VTAADLGSDRRSASAEGAGAVVERRRAASARDGSDGRAEEHDRAEPDEQHKPHHVIESRAAI